MTFQPIPPPPNLRRSPTATARYMLSECWDGRLPVDPSAIARNLGLHVRPKNPFDPDSAGWSGRFDADAKSIEFDASEALVRQRFTISHELGHFALKHGTRFRDNASAFSSRNSDLVEREANQFAAELLMPAEQVRSLVSSGRFSSVEDLASIFKVSKVAMAYRVANLGIGGVR